LQLAAFPVFSVLAARKTSVVVMVPWESEGGQEKQSPLDFENFSKNVVFKFRVGKNKFHYFWIPLEKFWKNPLVTPSGKNLSDAHGWCFPRTNVPPV